MERKGALKKVKYCGSCEDFQNRDDNGYGKCARTGRECSCVDKCYLVRINS